MKTFDRRHFLSTVSCTLAASVFPSSKLYAEARSTPACWLEVAAPFIVEVAAQGVQTDLIQEEVKSEMLSLRLVDERATLLLSIVQLDRTLRALALDYGSDCCSTFLDFGYQ